MREVGCPKLRYDTHKVKTSIKNVNSTGARDVSIVIELLQDYKSTRIYEGEDTPTIEEIKKAISIAKTMNLRVMLKPQIRIMNSHSSMCEYDDSSDNNDIDMQFNAIQWSEWFSNYTYHLEKYAALSVYTPVEILCIGTGVSNSTIKKADEWKTMIQLVRSKLNNNVSLTYAASWVINIS